MTVQYYRQVALRKNTSILVAWIPERFAIPGSYVSLRSNNGWLVTAVYGREVDPETLPRQARKSLQSIIA